MNLNYLSVLLKIHQHEWNRQSISLNQMLGKQLCRICGLSEQRDTHRVDILVNLQE